MNIGCFRMKLLTWLFFKIYYKMVVKTAYMIAITKRENVIGVVLMVGAVDYYG